MDDAVLRRHVELFNQGVRTGDFAPMLERFADDAELAFVGAPFGPYRGKEEIARAYREQRPDDTIAATNLRVEGSELVADYAWSRGGGGEVRVASRDGRIVRLVVVLD